MNNFTSANLQNSSNLFMQDESPNLDNERVAWLFGALQNGQQLPSNPQTQMGSYGSEYRQEFDSVTSGLFKCFAELKVRERETANENMLLQNQLKFMASNAYKQIEEVNGRNASLQVMNAELERQLDVEREKNASNYQLTVKHEIIKPTETVETVETSEPMELVETSETVEDDRLSKLLASKERYKKKFNNERQLVSDLQAEMNEKNNQLNESQTESKLLQKKVDAFDAFFQVFIDRMRLVFDNISINSTGLSKEDDIAIDGFIEDLKRHKQQIMNGKRTEHESDGIQGSEPVVLISDEELLQEVEASSQLKNVDELSRVVCKLKGLMYAEQVKLRLFEAKSLQANESSEFAAISTWFMQFVEDTITKSKDSRSLKDLQDALFNLHTGLKNERVLIKEFESKISMEQKRAVLAEFSEQSLRATKKLKSHAESIRKKQPKVALKLLYTCIGIRLANCVTTDGIANLWEVAASCFKSLDLNRRVVDCCDEMIKYKPGNSSFYFARACAYNDLNEYGNAIVDIDRALELNPSNKGAQKLKEEIFSKLNK